MEFIQAVLNANQEIYSYLSQGMRAEDHRSMSLGAGGDMSLAIDLMAEKIFIDHLSSFGTIHTEERGIVANPHTTAYIVIDPIDGSDNLVSHFPYYGTSVAYFENGICTKAVIVNLANADLFVKDEAGFRRGKLGSSFFKPVEANPYCKLGLFERAYCSTKVAPLLKKGKIKYRSPGAFALSLAYAREVSFVIFEGAMRCYDIEAGRFMCDDLHLYHMEDIFLVSKDKEIFDKIIDLFISN